MRWRAQSNTRESGDVHIAYRVFGDGPRDIVLIPGTLSHVELYWELPANEYLLKRLTSFARVIVFDKRGQGLSDRVAEQTLEERIGDVRAVMDAAGSKRATVFGWSEGGPMCIDVRRHLPRANLGPRDVRHLCVDEGRTMGLSPGAIRSIPCRSGGALGRRHSRSLQCAEPRKDKAFIQWFGRLERAAASPGAILALFRANYEIDVRHLLPSIRVPTLILHRVGDSTVPVACGRDMAQHIPGAKYRRASRRGPSAPGRSNRICWIVLLDEIEEFITGARHRPEPDRVLATVMFTDIVRSTERAAELGDSRWRELLNNYYAVVRKELTAFRGREVNTAGDGLLATFDGPARAIRCACSVRERLRPLGLQVRTGLHTGECELIGDDVGGIAVHIAARVAATAAPDEVLVSSTVKDLVAGSGCSSPTAARTASRACPANGACSSSK